MLALCLPSTSPLVPKLLSVYVLRYLFDLGTQLLVSEGFV
jgi:hypothetical protein